MTILYEDLDLVAVEKPEGLAVIPEADRKRESLRELVQSACAEKIYVVHRLDKNASGVILFAKSAVAHRHLSSQFAERQVHKVYTALLQGEVSGESGVIDSPIREYGSGRMGVDPERGKASHTAYRVARRFRGFTLVEARPRTGRRHQLRVHFFSIGHAIAGDLRYGDPALQARFPRLMLHASLLSFRSLDGKEVAVESPLPVSFLQQLEALA